MSTVSTDEAALDGPVYGPTPPTMRELRQAVIREHEPAEAHAWDRRYELQRVDATPAQLAEARDWAADCVWKEDPEEIAEYSDNAVVRGVNQHYDGGWHELVRNADLEPEPTRPVDEREAE